MKVKKYLNTGLVLLICLLHIAPFIILLNLSFKPVKDTSSKWLFPTSLYLDNFSSAWNQAHLDRALINNLIITFAVVALVIVVGASASYPLARFPTRLNNFVYTVAVACLIVPALTILVPLYKFMVDIGGVNSLWAIIGMHVTFSLPISIFLFTGFIHTIPRELDEAGLMDGCSRQMIFYRIIFPLLKPVTTTVAILIGLAVWNDYQFSIFFLQKREVQTVPVTLSQFFSQYQNNLNWVAAGCLISMLPMTVLYLILQKYFVKGLSEGAIKG
jgi:raffinose/stachyose/melibiose transport system permease protein